MSYHFHHYCSTNMSGFLDDFFCTGGPNVQPQHVSVLTDEIQGLVNMSIPRVVRSYRLIHNHTNFSFFYCFYFKVYLTRYIAPFFLYCTYMMLYCSICRCELILKDILSFFLGGKVAGRHRSIP